MVESPSIRIHHPLNGVEAAYRSEILNMALSGAFARAVWVLFACGILLSGALLLVSSISGGGGGSPLPPRVDPGPSRFHMSPPRTDSNALAPLTRFVPPVPVGTSGGTELEATTTLTVTLFLAPQNLTSVDRYIANLTNPASPSFRQYPGVRWQGPSLDPTEATSSAYRTYFSGYGLADTMLGLGEIVLSGQAADFERAFHTRLLSFGSGPSACVGAEPEPSLPVQLVDSLSAVWGLGNTAPVLPFVSSAGVSPLDLSPTDIYSAYDIGPVYSDGFYGQAAIGLAEECTSTESPAGFQSDLNSFDTAHFLPSLTVHFVGNGSSSCTFASTSWANETNLDIQAAHLIAPAAPIYACLDGPTNPNPLNCDSLLTADSRSDGISIISDSFASSVDTPSILSYAAIHGITVLAAAGDTGEAINYPASDSNVIGVGGTWFPLLSPEGAWGGTEWLNGTFQWMSTGGGCDGADRPPYLQTGVSGYACAGKRGVPDVSAVAGPFDTYIHGAAIALAGTSLSAPLWAGVIDLVQQATGAPGPYLNYVYQWAESPRYDQFFNDITTGCSNFGTGGWPNPPPLSGWCAGTGWDGATGVGSPNVAGLALGWAAGADYTGPATSATDIQADITVPTALPSPGSNYSVFVGGYGSNHVYYMSGVAAHNGMWGFFSGYTVGSCGLSAVLSFNNFTLTPGTAYTFRVYVTTGRPSTVTMEVDLQETTVSWSKDTVTSTASSIGVGDTSPCGTSGEYSMPGWALAEFVSQSPASSFNASMPTWDFNFTHISYIHLGTTYGVPAGSMGEFYSANSPAYNPDSDEAPYVYPISYGGAAKVTIANQLFTLSQTSQWIFVARSNHGSVAGSAVNEVSGSAGCSSGCIVSLTQVNDSPLSSGVRVALTYASGTVPFNYTVTVYASATATCGTWWVIVTGTSNSMTPIGASSFNFTFSVTGCGGGGCVAVGTNILTPGGWAQVQALTVNETVKEYDPLRGVMFTGEVLYINMSTVNSTLIINNGLLNLTLTEQPIWMRNSTYTGWLSDPQNLTTSDQIWDPFNVTWVSITSLVVGHFPTTVYDVVTSTHWNDFIANSILLDMKAHGGGV